MEDGRPRPSVALLRARGMVARSIKIQESRRLRGGAEIQKKISRLRAKSRKQTVGNFLAS